MNKGEYVNFKLRKLFNIDRLFILMIVVSEMTYTVSSGTLNSSIPYHTDDEAAWTSEQLNLGLIPSCHPYELLGGHPTKIAHMRQKSRTAYILLLIVQCPCNSLL